MQASQISAMRVIAVLVLTSSAALACCPAPRQGQQVVNADQTVIMIWDASSKTQHFIRKASFKSDGEDFGFLIPSPATPELEESGNEAFSYLAQVTAPEIVKVKAAPHVGCGFSSDSPLAATKSAQPDVRVLSEKLVAGFNAVVLEADSSKELVGWLKEHGYAFSPEIEAWAKPYIESKWKITALKIAKDKDAKNLATLDASALRMSFHTDKPLFPYREPVYKDKDSTLSKASRMLRVYFLADAPYAGEFTKETPWTGRVVWANTLNPNQMQQLLEKLRLPKKNSPSTWWLTEFEDDWPYKPAPADVYFVRNDEQKPVKRPAQTIYVSSTWPTDGTAYALAAIVVAIPLSRRVRRYRNT